jgi:hypothetical protein
MTQSTLVRYLKSGYPHFKTESQLPVWLLPEHSFGGIADKLGEEKLLALSRPLNLNKDFTEQIEALPAPETLPDENWHQTIQSWPSLGQVWAILGTLLEVTSELTEKFQQRKLQAKPEIVCRALVILGLAPLVPQGNHLVRDIALILKSEPAHPVELIKRYAQAVSENDLTSLDQVEASIARYQLWQEWSERFMAAIYDYPEIPRLVGITPPVSSELVEVLAEMLQEETHAEFGRDHC